MPPDSKKTRARAIAFYLPQFHPIPENDEWWGRGFTEWVNVAKAKPLFPGHYQPHLPADLGFYDLRLPEARQAQADLAREYGIHGFCYYHYWFNGKRLLERPFDEVLASRHPSLPFCLCWANENWTRRWDGQDDQILVDQTYSENDDRAHIRWLLRAFRDERYIRIGGRPLFLVYRANKLADPMKTTAIWREEARRSGVGDLYLCRVESFADERDDPTIIGFDAAVEFQPDWCNYDVPRRVRGHNVYEFSLVVDQMLRKGAPAYKRFPCVMPSWDNSPRRRAGATIFRGSTPALYEKWLKAATRKVVAAGAEEPIVFINAWNEWAEGNHLEPCQKWGRDYLEATWRAVEGEAERGTARAEGAGESTALDAEGTKYSSMIRALGSEAIGILQHVRTEVTQAAAELEGATAELTRLRWLQRATEELAALVPPGATLILVDGQEWGSDVMAGRHVIPFLERDGQYWGAPPDDETAIRELERVRKSGADFMVFASPAFWWFDYYTGTLRHLRSNFRCLLENDRLVVFDLRAEVGRTEASPADRASHEGV